MPYFKNVQAFCLFSSTSRSGHSIMAHLLSAHPKVMICDELSAVSFFKKGYSREQVFALIKFQDYRHQQRKRKKSGYSYWVDNAWQNLDEKYPVVIGDAKGSRTTELLGGEPGYVDLLRSRLKLPLRVIFHLRNPFDSITTATRKSKKAGRIGYLKRVYNAIGSWSRMPNPLIEERIQKFVEKEKKMTAAYNLLDNDEKLVQRHEDVIDDPENHFIRMFEFLGVEPKPKVVKICAGKIWKKPNVTRNQIGWAEQDVERLKDCLRQSELFRLYLDD